MKRNELLSDYAMLDEMSKQLQAHQKNVTAIGKRVAKNSASIDIKEGLVENLEIVSNHMRRAQRELDKAKKRLKLI